MAKGVFMFGKIKFENELQGRIKPFEIVKDVYFIGVYKASTHLIDTGDGLIVIDPGYNDSLYHVVDSIYRLGFKPEQVKYIINTHWHWDHVEATERLSDLTGAKTLIGRYDVDNCKRYFNPDILIKDGDTLTLGNKTITFLETPGHTEGVISFFFNTEDNGKIYRVGSFGGAGVKPLKKEALGFANARINFLKSIERLRKEKVDVFIGNHVWHNGTFEKAKVLEQTGENQFIDSTLWEKFLDHCIDKYNKVLEEDGE